MPAKIDVPPRICEECGETFHRRTEPTLESAEKFRVRKFCGSDCRNKAASRRKTEENLEELPPRICQNRKCGKTFTRRAGEPKWRYKVRKFCERACQYASVPKKDANVTLAEAKKQKDQLNARLKHAEEEKRKKRGENNGDKSVIGGPKPVKVWRPETWGGPRIIEPEPREPVRLSDLPRVEGNTV